MVTVNDHKNLIDDLNDKRSIAKKDLIRLSVSQLPRELPNFKTKNTTKDNLLADWLSQWIDSSIKNKKIDVDNLLPKKSDIANYVGVSIGTVQNAIRFIEDKGYVESKQRIGTLIRNLNTEIEAVRKQVSKRDQAIIAIKNLIVEGNYTVGEVLPSSRRIAQMIGSANNTTRLALEHLASEGCIEAKGLRGNKANWVLKQLPALTDKEQSIIDSKDNSDITAIETDTLVDQLERDLKLYLFENYTLGSKLPSHFELADIFKVSIKTVHDATKRLCDQGILLTKRGRYGTTVVRIPSKEKTISDDISKLFAPATDVSLYNYERVETHLQYLIKEQYKIGDKLPSMNTLAQELNVSSNTIRKAMQILEERHIVKFSRGRYGGTFVTQLPDVAKPSTPLQWLSVNPEHIAAYKK